MLKVRSVRSYYKAFLFLILIISTFLFAANIRHTIITTNRSLLSTSLLIRNNAKRLEIIPKELITRIEENKLYSDFIFPNSSKTYSIEVFSDKLILILSLKIVTKDAILGVELKGPASRVKFNIAYDPSPYIYYVRGKGEIQIVVANLKGSNTIQYMFYVDVSEPLGSENSKDILMEGGRVGLYVDLRKDDVLSLNLNYGSDQTLLGIKIFVLCYQWVTGGDSYYMLRLYEETLENSLNIKADSGGRYYIIIESVEGEGAFSLESVFTSPPWNQEWFWIAFSILFAVIIFPFFLIKIRQKGKLDRVSLLTFTGYYLWFPTIGLAYSTIGSFNYGTSYTSLFYASIFFYGLSLGLTAYAAWLDRKKKTFNCPYCGKEVNIKEENNCCGKMIKNVSTAWFLVPLSFSFFFFFIGYLSSSFELSGFDTIQLWLYVGSIFGGIVSWWINRNINRIKAWKFLISGILFSFPSYLLIGLIMDILFQPDVELELPGKLLRIRVAPFTLPSGLILAFILLTICLIFSIAFKIRKGAS